MGLRVPVRQCALAVMRPAARATIGSDRNRRGARLERMRRQWRRRTRGRQGCDKQNRPGRGRRHSWSGWRQQRRRPRQQAGEAAGLIVAGGGGRRRLAAAAGHADHAEGNQACMLGLRQGTGGPSAGRQQPRQCQNGWQVHEPAGNPAQAGQCRHATMLGQRRRRWQPAGGVLRSGLAGEVASEIKTEKRNKKLLRLYFLTRISACR